jgi:hypothetical protein
VRFSTKDVLGARVRVGDFENTKTEVLSVKISLPLEQSPNVTIPAVSRQRVLAPAVPDSLVSGRAADVELPGLRIRDQVDPTDRGQGAPPGRDPSLDDEVELALRQEHGPVTGELRDLQLPRTNRVHLELRRPLLRQEIGLPTRPAEPDDQAAVELLAQGTPLRPVSKGMVAGPPSHLQHCVEPGEEPQVWLGHRDEGNHEVAVETPAALQRLPLVKPALQIDIEGVNIAVPHREVDLASARRRVQVKRLKQREKIHGQHPWEGRST